MTKLRGKELSELYPRPKTYDELKAEHEARNIARQPRFIAIKCAVSTTLGTFTIFTSYKLIEFVLQGGMSSPTTALAAAAFSIFIGLGAIAILWYLYSIIDRLVTVSMSSTNLFYTCLLTIVILCSLLLKILIGSVSYPPSLAVVLAIAYVLTLVITKLLIKNDDTKEQNS